MNENPIVARQQLLSLAACLLLLGGCSLRPALNHVYTSRGNTGAFAPPADPGRASAELGEVITTRGNWTCPAESCEFRGVSGGMPFRSYAPQRCPFCGTDLEKGGGD